MSNCIAPSPRYSIDDAILPSITTRFTGPRRMALISNSARPAAPVQSFVRMFYVTFEAVARLNVHRDAVSTHDCQVETAKNQYRSVSRQIRAAERHRSRCSEKSIGLCTYRRAAHCKCYTSLGVSSQENRFHVADQETGSDS
jgi:hypothetical protein